MKRNLAIYLDAPTALVVGSLGALALMTLKTRKRGGSLEMEALQHELANLHSHYPIEYVTVNASRNGPREGSAAAVFDVVQAFATETGAHLAEIDLRDVYQVATGYRSAGQPVVFENAQNRVAGVASREEAIAVLMFHSVLTDQRSMTANH